MDNQERMNQGIAVVTGALGGAKVNSSLAALIATWHGRDVDAYSDESLIAIADIDSLLELNAADRTRLAEAIKRNSECMAANVAAVARANELQARNDNQAITIRDYGVAVSDLKASVSEWRKEAEIAERLRKEAEADCELARRQRNAELASHNELAAVIAEASEVIAGLPLATTAVDGAQGLVKLYWRLELLAAETCGERHARHARADSGKAAAPVTLKAELLGILDSVSEELIESQDALDLIRLFADRL